MMKYFLVFFGGLALAFASLFAGFEILFLISLFASVLVPMGMFSIKRIPRWLDAASEALANLSNSLRRLTVAKLIYFLISAPYILFIIFFSFAVLPSLVPYPPKELAFLDKFWYGLVSAIALFVLAIPLSILRRVMSPWLYDVPTHGAVKNEGSSEEKSKEVSPSAPVKKEEEPLDEPEHRGVSETGSKTLPDGTILSGTFTNGRLQGTGHAQYPNGYTYQGSFVNSQPNGKGKGVFPDGSVYEGVFLNGEMHGNGELRCADGNRYKGKFKNNKIQGFGVLTYSDGGVTEGQFEDGKLVRDVNKTKSSQIPNAEVEVEISLEEAYTGIEAKEISAVVQKYTHNGDEGRKPCGELEASTLKINIPAGIKDGQIIRIAEKGNQEINGNSSDLLIKVSVKKHPKFTRIGDDLHTVHELPSEIAEEGGYMEIHAIDGGWVRVNCAKNLVSGQKVRLRGKGMPKGDDQYGHLVVEYRIESQ